MLTIGITTFKRRFDLVSNLIKSIKKYDPEIEIILTINADYKEPFDNQYRENILKLASETVNCFPVVFPTFTSLSKMWNTIILNATNEFVLVLNDDLEFVGNHIIPTIKEKIKKITLNNNLSEELTIINSSWSYFIASKTIIDELGYFDERLLAFGEEDGDMTWRYIEKFNKKINELKIDGINNIQEGYKIAHPNMVVEDVHQTRFVPKFNRNFIKEKYKKYIFGIKGMFDNKVKQVLPNLAQYPYEKFKRQNYEKM